MAGDLSEWFVKLLTSSGDAFVWSVHQVPSERQSSQPPLPLGEWSVSRHVFHMLHYERAIALPSVHQWLHGKPTVVIPGREESDWKEEHSLEGMVREFEEVRARQIAILSGFDDSRWEETRDTVWGAQTLRWVSSKTYQHTAEHTHNVLSLALLWDLFQEPSKRG